MTADIRNEGPEFVHDAARVTEIVRRLLRGAQLTAVFLGGDPRLEFARSHTSDDGAPLMAAVTVRSEWRIGEASAWEEFLMTPVRFEASPDAKREGMMAYALACLYRGGAVVNDAVVRDDGTLLLSTSMGMVTISGREDVFEESWIIDVPGGVPMNDEWSVVCTGRGELFGRGSTPRK